MSSIFLYVFLLRFQVSDNLLWTAKMETWSRHKMLERITILTGHAFFARFCGTFYTYNIERSVLLSFRHLSDFNVFFQRLSNWILAISDFIFTKSFVCSSLEVFSPHINNSFFFMVGTFLALLERLFTTSAHPYTLLSGKNTNHYTRPLDPNTLQSPTP